MRADSEFGKKSIRTRPPTLLQNLVEALGFPLARFEEPLAGNPHSSPPASERFGVPFPVGLETVVVAVELPTVEFHDHLLLVEDHVHLPAVSPSIDARPWQPEFIDEGEERVLKLGAGRPGRFGHEAAQPRRREPLHDFVELAPLQPALEPQVGDAGVYSPFFDSSTK